jgi:hypothetical protein
MKSVASILKTAALLLAFALVTAGSGWAKSEEQESLGDVARKQKATKGQQEVTEKKVLTNEDLPPGSEASASPAPSGAASAGAEGQPAGEAAPAEGATEAAAQGEPSDQTPAQQADEARNKAESLKRDEASTERGIRRYEELLANTTDPNLRELYQRALRNAQNNLGTIQKQRADAEKEAAAKEAAAKEAQPPQ